MTHRLDEVFRIADRVTVLRDGHRVASRPVIETKQADLVAWIVGGALAATDFATASPSQAVLLKTDRLAVPQQDGAGLAGPVSFTVHRGETLGLVGLRGAGHHAVGRALFGALPKQSGRAILKGCEIDVRSPAAAMAQGIGFVSSQRGEEALASKLTVLENLYVSARARGLHPFRLVGRRRELASGREALARFSVRPPDPARVIATLSGGNQQKVVVARWMESNVDLLILEEPTIGVDVGSKAEIYRDLDLAHNRGRAVLLISSDFEEVEKICHRALVFDRGKVVAEVHRPHINVAGLTALATGATQSWKPPREPVRPSTTIPNRHCFTNRLCLGAACVAGNPCCPFLGFKARNVSDLLQYAFNHQQQDDPSHAGLGCVRAHDSQPLRLVRGLHAWDRPGPRHWPAGPGLNWPEATGLVLLLGALVGLCNGLLVTVVGIDSFIATLGTGTLLYGLNAWYTGGQQVVATLPDSFLSLSGAWLGIPLPAFYVLTLSFSMWIVFEFMPLGRHLYVLGANPKAAELNGISAKRYVTGAFIAAGFVSAFAGVVLQSQLQVGQSSVGQEYLLPAFTAALLGATSIRPGRVNVWGTVLAVAVLAVTVAGLNQLGAPFFVEPLFNGAMLILAVGLAVTAARRRVKLGAATPEQAIASSRVPEGGCPCLARKTEAATPTRARRSGRIGTRHGGAPTTSGAMATCSDLPRCGRP